MPYRDPSETKSATEPTEPDLTALPFDELLRRRTRLWPLSLLWPRPRERTFAVVTFLAFAASLLAHQLARSQKMAVFTGILIGASALGWAVRTLWKRPWEGAVSMAAREAYAEFITNVLMPAREQIWRLRSAKTRGPEEDSGPERYMRLQKEINAWKGRGSVVPESILADETELGRLRKPLEDLTREVGSVWSKKYWKFINPDPTKEEQDGCAGLLAIGILRLAEQYRDLLTVHRDPGFQGDPTTARGREEQLRNSLRERVALLHASLERAEDAYHRLETGGDPPAVAGPPAEL